MKLGERPRLVDWGLYAAALYESQGWGVATFMEDWKVVEETQQQGTLDGSIVAQAVIFYMKDKDRVELSAAKLHAAIENRADDDLNLKGDKTWPKTGRTLWKKIREVTPLLEVHGIRAYRKNDNRAGRPIILDTDFSDGPDDDQGEDNYAKHTDDTADDNRGADDNADDNFATSSADPPHTNGRSDDNGQNGRYFGDSLAFNVSDRKEKKREGESNTDLSSVSSAKEVSELLDNPPDWLRVQADKHRTKPAERTLNPLCVAVAAHLYGDATRWREVKPTVTDWLGKVSA